MAGGRDLGAVAPLSTHIIGSTYSQSMGPFFYYDPFIAVSFPPDLRASTNEF